MPISLQAIQFFGNLALKSRVHTQPEVARWFVDEVPRMGTIYVKFGQFLSTRSDVFSPGVIQELSRLQEKVDCGVIRKCPEHLQAVVDAFDEVPFAIASIGQVHRARLVTGEEVAVKLRRENIEREAEQAMSDLLVFARLFDMALDQNMYGIMEEYRRSIECEIDYTYELENYRRLKENFARTGWVRVPETFDKLCDESVLVTEFVETTRLADVPREEGPRICRRLVRAFAMMIIDHGFFHADPHPGNLAVDKNGALVFFDCGMMNEIDPKLREHVIGLVLAASTGDRRSFTGVLIEMGMIDVAQRSQMQKVIGAIFQTDLRDTEAVLALGREQKIRIPNKYVLFLRSLGLVQSSMMLLDPDSRIEEIVQEYADVLFDMRTMVQKSMRDLTSIPSMIRNMEDIMEAVESGDVQAPHGPYSDMVSVLARVILFTVVAGYSRENIPLLIIVFMITELF